MVACKQSRSWYLDKRIPKTSTFIITHRMEFHQRAAVLYVASNYQNISMCYNTSLHDLHNCPNVPFSLAHKNAPDYSNFDSRLGKNVIVVLYDNGFFFQHVRIRRKAHRWFVIWRTSKVNRSWWKIGFEPRVSLSNCVFVHNPDLNRKLFLDLRWRSICAWLSVIKVVARWSHCNVYLIEMNMLAQAGQVVCRLPVDYTCRDRTTAPLILTYEEGKKYGKKLRFFV